MRELIRRNALVILIVGVIGTGIVLLNMIGLSRFTPREIFMWESSARQRIYGTPPDSWFTERQKLLERIAQLDVVREENERLRAALSFYSKKKYSFVLAHVVSRDPLSTALVYIDAGSDDGIAIGQPAIVGEGTLVGKVIKASSKSAVVELITADSSRIAVKTIDDEGTSGLLRGTVGIGSRLEYIRDIGSIAVGSVLITSGLEPSLPEGLVVGTVQKLVDSPDTLFAYADVLTAADMNELSIVSIVKGL